MAGTYPEKGEIISRGHERVMRGVNPVGWPYNTQTRRARR